MYKNIKQGENSLDEYLPTKIQNDFNQLRIEAEAKIQNNTIKQNEIDKYIEVLSNILKHAIDLNQDANAQRKIFFTKELPTIDFITTSNYEQHGYMPNFEALIEYNFNNRVENNKLKYSLYYSKTKPDKLNDEATNKQFLIKDSIQQNGLRITKDLISFLDGYGYIWIKATCGTHSVYTNALKIINLDSNINFEVNCSKIWRQFRKELSFYVTKTIYKRTKKEIYIICK